MKYNNIKNILRRQIKNNVRVLWAHNENINEFIMIYKNYNDKLPIFTPQQLLDKLNEI
tara:strand:+ start:1655 stop:1828 length:174 start_codon:yes stop_codon:yes gene_type:complete